MRERKFEGAKTAALARARGCPGNSVRRCDERGPQRGHIAGDWAAFNGGFFLGETGVMMVFFLLEIRAWWILVVGWI